MMNTQAINTKHLESDTKNSEKAAKKLVVRMIQQERKDPLTLVSRLKAGEYWAGHPLGSH